LRQLMCGLYGHDALIHFDDGRMSLQCSSCGYQTPGWDLRSETRPQATGAGSAARTVKMPIIGERRVA
jgi:hypothetical protein